MCVASRYYSGAYTYDTGGNIYVHLHADNIGRAMEGNSVPSSQVAKIFRDRKNQALQASKTQFKTLFKNSLNEKSRILLNQVFNNDDFMIKIQNDIGKKFQEALSVDKMQALMRIQRSGIATNDFARSILKKNEFSIKNFNILLQSLVQACQLLGTESGNRLALLLSHQHEIKSSKQLGKFLLKALENFKKQNQKVLLSELEIQQAEQITSNINSLARALQTRKTSSNNDLKQDGLRQMIQNIFNTGFAESISAMLKSTAYVALDEAFKASLTGSSTTQIQYSDEFGKTIAKSEGRSAYGKADAFFNNVKVKLEGTNQQITLDIGISDKFYKMNEFPGLKENKGKNIYSSGSGGSLVQALWSSFGTNLRYLYYAYNTLGHGDKTGWSQAQGALDEIILTRQITRLFASRGGNTDFAQFMFVNGKIVPIWDIIMSTTKNISLSSSQGGSPSQPVTLSIPQRGEIQKAAQTKKITLEERIYNVNKAVQKAKIIAHVNLNNL